MKPLFVYKYDPKKTKKNDEFYNLYVKDGNLWEEVYSNQKGSEIQNSFKEAIGKIK